MRVKMSFLCEHCDAEFEKPKDAMEHEASHYGLTMTEFSYWHLLSQAASENVLTPAKTRKQRRFFIRRSSSFAISRRNTT